MEGRSERYGICMVGMCRKVSLCTRVKGCTPYAVRTIRDGARGKYRLLPLPETRIYPLVDQLFGQSALVGSVGRRLALGRELGPRALQALVVVGAVVDVAYLVPLFGLVDRAEVAAAQEALFEELGRRAEVAWVLLVAEVACLDQHGFLGS